MSSTPHERTPVTLDTPLERALKLEGYKITPFNLGHATAAFERLKRNRARMVAATPAPLRPLIHAFVSARNEASQLHLATAAGGTLGDYRMALLMFDGPNQGGGIRRHAPERRHGLQPIAMLAQGHAQK